MDETTDTFLKNLRLPVIPEVARDLIRTLDNESVSIDDLNDVISKDPSLVANLLRIANSAAFGLPRKVSSLHTAISVVGLNQIRVRAISICIANAVPMPESINKNDFWRESMMSAGYARILSQRCGVDPNKGWLAGVIMRLGFVLMAQYNADMARVFVESKRSASQRWGLQRQLMGFDEGQAMSELTKRWDFPSEITNALHNCSTPLQPFSDLAAVIHLASLCSDCSMTGEDIKTVLPIEVLNALKLQPDWVADHMPGVEEMADLSILG